MNGDGEDGGLCAGMKDCKETLNNSRWVNIAFVMMKQAGDALPSAVITYFTYN